MYILKADNHSLHSLYFFCHFVFVLFCKMMCFEAVSLFALIRNINSDILMKGETLTVDETFKMNIVCARVHAWVRAQARVHACVRERAFV